MADLRLANHLHAAFGRSGTYLSTCPTLKGSHHDPAQRKAMRKFTARSSRTRRGRNTRNCPQAASKHRNSSGTTIDEQRSEQSRFQLWWQQAQVQANALLPAEFAGVRGMAAAKDINTGDSIVILPRNAALLVTPTMKCPFPELVPETVWSKSQWFVKMALMLVHEKQKGTSSTVSGYVEQLPSDFSTLLHWLQDELQLLMYPHLLQQVDQQRQSWHTYFTDMQTACPKLSISEKEMVWALQCVRSRAFSGPYSGPPIRQRAKLAAPFAILAAAYTQIAHLPLEQVLNGAIAAVLFNIIYDTLLSQRLRWFAMCPVIDSMNHQSSSQNEVAYEYFTDRFSVTAQRPYAKGQEVFITYGLQSNDKLLQYYGFIEAKNPADVYTLPDLLQTVSQMPQLGVSQQRIAAVQEACHSDARQQVSLSKTGVSDATLQAVRMLTASDDMFSKRSAADFAKQVDPLNEQAALQALRDICLSLGSTMARLPAKVSDAKLSQEKTELARQFRQEKSRTLQACCRDLDARLRQLQKSG